MAELDTMGFICFVETTDDFHPNIRENMVEVSVITVDDVIRVIVSGDDDFSYAKEYITDHYDPIGFVRLFLMLVTEVIEWGSISINELKSMGFEFNN